MVDVQYSINVVVTHFYRNLLLLLFYRYHHYHHYYYYYVLGDNIGLFKTMNTIPTYLGTTGY